MIDKRAVNLLGAHADLLVGRPQAWQRANPSPQEREQVAPLLRFAEYLKGHLPPVQPSPEFAASLRRELVGSSRVYVERAERKRRSVLIGAAVGSVVSVASLITAVALLVRARARTHARPMAAR